MKFPRTDLHSTRIRLESHKESFSPQLCTFHCRFFRKLCPHLWGSIPKNFQWKFPNNHKIFTRNNFYGSRCL
jgi:hypothetical protein